MLWLLEIFICLHVEIKDRLIFKTYLFLYLTSYFVPCLLERAREVRKIALNLSNTFAKLPRKVQHIRIKNCLIQINYTTLYYRLAAKPLEAPRGAWGNVNKKLMWKSKLSRKVTLPKNSYKPSHDVLKALL